MDFLKAACTDIGIKKKTNQDSFCIKIADTSIGRVSMIIICDGMGGLAKGEVASASVINAFSQWFENQLPLIIDTVNEQVVQEQWNELIQMYNAKITNYGAQQGIQLGTTFTGMLLLADGRYIVGHVGDTRVYKLTEQSFDIITEDQTVINREIKSGRLTREQAMNDPRKNVLLQCIGASRIVEPDFYTGKAVQDDVFMFCSDGFRHKVNENEIWQALRPTNMLNEDMMQQNISRLIECDKQRKEVDNITAVAIKIIG